MPKPSVLPMMHRLSFAGTSNAGQRNARGPVFTPWSGILDAVYTALAKAAHVAAEFVMAMIQESYAT